MKSLHKTTEVLETEQHPDPHAFTLPGAIWRTQSAATRHQVACCDAPGYLLDMKLSASLSTFDLHGTASIEACRKRNEPSKFWHAFRAANRTSHSWAADDESQTGWEFERTVAKRVTIAPPARMQASSKAYPSYLPSRTPCLFECRAYARRPKGSGIVTRGRTTGLPARYQTDPAVYLTWQDLAAVYDALTFADEQGTPLTAPLTINWRTAPGFDANDPASWAHSHTRITESMRKWLIARSVPVAFTYVRERIVGRGAHTHFFVHLPRGRWAELRRELQRHLYSAGGFTESSAVHIGRMHNTSGMTTISQRLGMLQYVAKGINPAETIYIPGSGPVLLSQFIGITPVPQATLPQHCKRVGWSKDIGPGERAKAGYNDTNDVLRLAASLPG